MNDKHVRSNSIELVKKMSAMSDYLWQKLVESKEFCQQVLQVILSMPDLIVEESTPQKSLRNVEGRSVVLDVLCKDFEGQYFNIEVQKENDDDHQKRVRYNGSNVDTYVTEKGTKFEELPDVYVVFISMFDVFQKGKTIYHVDRVLRETGDIVENGFHEIYVNAAIDDHSDVAGLMKVLSSPEVLEDERFPIVCQQIKHFKEGRGRNAMCKLVEEYAEAYYEERLEEHAREQALKMLKKNMSREDIGEYTGLSLEEIDELEKEKLVKN